MAFCDSCSSLLDRKNLQQLYFFFRMKLVGNFLFSHLRSDSDLIGPR